MDVGQPEVAPLISVSKFSVINAQLVKYCRIEIVDMHGARRPFILSRLDRITVSICNVISVIIRLTISNAGLNTAPGHPCCEASWVVISPVILLGQTTLTISSTTKFTPQTIKG